MQRPISLPGDMSKRRRQHIKTPELKGSAPLTNAVIETEPESIRTRLARNRGVRRGIYALVPVIIAVISSINSLWNYFASDDLQQVLGNPFIKSLSNLPAAFTTSVWSFTATDIVFTADFYFRPVFSILFAINYALFGTAPLGWHLVNVLIHALVTLLVYVVAQEITGRNWVSMLTATLFAVHPAHAESVAWVSGVTDPLMMLLLLPTFYFYLRFQKRGAKYLLGCAIALYFLALLSKETAVALPVVVAYCELFYFESETAFKQRVIRAARILVLFAIPTAVYILMRYQALGALDFAGQSRYPLIPSLLTIPLAIVKYVGLMVLPWGYSYQHRTDFVESPVSPLFLVPLALLLLVAMAVARLKSREIRLGAVWFIVMLAPALASLSQFEPAYLVQERYLYAPSFGVTLAIALGIEWLAGRDWFGARNRIVAGAVAVLLVLVWGAILIRQNRVWDDTLSLHQNTIAVSPREPLAHASLSRSYYEAGWPRKAEASALTALDLDSRCAAAYLSLSYYARMSGKLDQASKYLEDGIAAIPEGPMTRHDLATMYLNLGLLYGQRKMVDLGEQKLLRSIEISPRAVAWYHTAQFYSEQGRFEDARVMYEQTLKHVPHWFAPIRLRLAMTYESMGDIPRAQSEFEKYLEIAPSDASDKESVRRHLTSLKGGASPKN